MFDLFPEGFVFSPSCDREGVGLSTPKGMKYRGGTVPDSHRFTYSLLSLWSVAQEMFLPKY